MCDVWVLSWERVACVKMKISVNDPRPRIIHCERSSGFPAARRRLLAGGRGSRPLSLPRFRGEGLRGPRVSQRGGVVPARLSLRTHKIGVKTYVCGFAALNRGPLRPASRVAVAVVAA